MFMVNSQIPEDPKRVNIFLATRSKVLNGGARSKRLQLLGTEGWHRLVRRVSLSVDAHGRQKVPLVFTNDTQDLHLWDAEESQLLLSLELSR